MGHGAGGRTRLCERQVRPNSPPRNSQFPQFPVEPFIPLAPTRLALYFCSLAPVNPTAISVSLQMWALWKGWPIIVAGTRCTGQATQHPPSPATRWTRLAQGPLRGRRSSPCLEMTTQGHLCWMSAKSELLGPWGGSHDRGEVGMRKAGPAISCAMASVMYITSLSSA